MSHQELNFGVNKSTLNKIQIPFPQCSLVMGIVRFWFEPIPRKSEPYLNYNRSHRTRTEPAPRRNWAQQKCCQCLSTQKKYGGSPKKAGRKQILSESDKCSIIREAREGRKQAREMWSRWARNVSLRTVQRVLNEAEFWDFVHVRVRSMLDLPPQESVLLFFPEPLLSRVSLEKDNFHRWEAVLPRRPRWAGALLDRQTPACLRT